MSKKGGSAPDAPDPQEVAQAESQWNRLDVFSPSGAGVRHGYTGPDGSFVAGTPPEGAQAAQKLIESPTQGAIRGMLEPGSEILTANLLADNLAGMPAAPRPGQRETMPGGGKMGGGMYGPVTPVPMRPGGGITPVSMTPDRNSVGQSIFDRSFSMMAPAIDRANSRLLTNLQARGLPVGGDAFNEAYGNQMRETQDTIARLAMDADIASGQEQSRMFGLNERERDQAMDELGQSFDMTERERDQALQERGQTFDIMAGGRELGMREQSHDFNMQKAARDQSLAELSSLMTGSLQQTPAMPSGSASPVNIGGAINNQYNAQMQSYNAGQQRAGANAAALGNVAGSLLLKCSMDIKEIDGKALVEDCEMAYRMMPIYAWRYLPEAADAMNLPQGRRYIGPVAQDFHSLTGLGSDQEINILDFLGTMAGALQSAIHRIDQLEADLARAKGEVC